MTRREFVVRGLMAAGGSATAGCVSGGWCKDEDGNRLPKWKPGQFDIHFIQTGVGEQTFFIFPDGTTMLMDCGDMYRPQYLKHVPRQPSAERLGGEWVSRYVQRLIPQRTIDYFILSHYHSDHCGNPELRSEMTKDGRKVCGIARFAEDFNIGHYFDHQYPNVGLYALNRDMAMMEMLNGWIVHMQRKCGMVRHSFTVGALNQIAMLRSPTAYPSFSVRNLFSNARYWDGSSGTVDYAKRYFAMHPDADGKIPENTLSLGVRFEYGPFKAYFGGDIDIPDHEALLGPVVGPVDVCKTNHHACPSSMGEAFCRAVRAQAYLTSVWSPNQIDERNLVNMSSRELYPGDRVILPGYLPEVKRREYAGRNFMRDFLPVQGHSVIKVAPGGKTFRLFVLDSTDESMRVLCCRDFVSGVNGAASKNSGNMLS